MTNATLFSQIAPFAMQLANYLKLAADHYATLRMAGQMAGPEMVAVYLEEKMAAWDPKVGGKQVLDPETRKAGIRFLAGVAVNLAGA